MTNFQFPMTNNKFKNQEAGFILLFAVTLSSILLAVALGVASIAEKEIKFGTSIRETNDAFLAADTGIECAIFHDKSSATAFPMEGQETSINCASSNIRVTWNGIHNFAIEGLGSDGESCTKVNVIKEELTELSVIKTTIIAKGYNIGDVGCEDPGMDRVEREIQVSYLQDNPAPPAPASDLGYPSGTPHSIPGTIEAEDYDTGGEGISYHDGDSVNSGGAYRSDGVDISNTGGEEHVGWFYAGEWTNYSINVTTAGSYTLKAKVASPGTGGTFMIKLDGQDVTGIMAIPNTGGWQTWTTVSKVVSLTPGIHILTVEGVADGTTSYVGNIDNIDLTTFVPAPPSVDLTADATTINNGDSTTLRWETSGVTLGCTATDGWSGNKSTPAGSQSTGVLTATTTFTLTCSNAYGQTADSVEVTVTSSGSGTLSANPNPIPVCSPATTGITTITGSSTVTYEVRVGDPITGGVLSGYNKPAEPSFSYTTGNWVSNPTTFYLVAVSDNSILATVTVTLSCSTPTYRASAQAGVASGNLTISKPTGVVTNDVMVASIALRPNTATITPPAGWNIVGTKLDNSNLTANSLVTYRKVAGASEPANYVWTLGSHTGAAGGILAFSGVSTSNPIQAVNGQNTPYGSQHSTPSVNTTSANTIVITAHAYSSAPTWSPPAGMTERVDVQGGNESLEINTVTQSTAGATGIKTAVATGDDDVGNAQIIILQP